MSDFPSAQLTDADLDEWLSGYILEALSPAEMADVENYLRSHPELEPRLHELQEVMGYLAHQSRQAAPEGLRSKILAIPATAAPPQAQADTTPAASGKILTLGRRSWRTWGWAIAALLVAGLGIDNLLLRQRLTLLEASVDHSQTEEEEYVFELEGTAGATLASAKVIIDAHAGKVLVGARNLPPLPADETYYLWAFTDERTPILCGNFNTDATGQLLAHFSVSPDIYTRPITFMRVSKGSLDSGAEAPVEPQTVIMTSESLRFAS